MWGEEQGSDGETETGEESRPLRHLIHLQKLGESPDWQKAFTLPRVALIQKSIFSSNAWKLCVEKSQLRAIPRQGALYLTE